MQFPEKIISIKPGDKVLDIGPGGNPHPKATVYLELRMSEEEAAGQRGYAEKPDLKGEVVYYDGEKFPFKDKEFDYVICSHVIEHVPEPKKFLAEMFRVAKRGYMEYPTVYYEYLYNFKYHINFVKYNQTTRTLFYMPKHKSPLNYFFPLQQLMYRSLGVGYSGLVVELREIMFEGFEWSEEFFVRQSSDLSKYVFSPDVVAPLEKAPKELVSVRYAAHQLSRALLNKLKKIIKFNRDVSGKEI